MSTWIKLVVFLIGAFISKPCECQGRDGSTFPQRLLSAVTDIQGEEVKALVLQKKLDVLHTSDFVFLPLAIQYGLQEETLKNLSGTKLASVVKVNPGDTVIATKVSAALIDESEQQIEFLQALGTKLLPGVQRIIMRRLLNWWGDPHSWKERELGLLISAGNPLLAYMPQTQLQSLDDELADRFVTTLGQTQDIARGWWRKPMSVKKAWFELAKGARYFGAVDEWSFRRMQKLSFLLEGASPEDLELIPPIPEIKGLVIQNHYTELQARIVFDAFYNNPPLSQEDLQEFQFHVLDLIPNQLQRFDFADSFGTLDEMLSILDRQPDPSYPTVLQISYFMWPVVNTSNSAMTIAPPSTWQKRELSQIGKLFFLLPKSVMSQIKSDFISWDSSILNAIRSSHLSPFQIWRLTSQILPSVDDRLKPDYIFMIPSPFQKGIPSHNISQALLGTTTVRPEIIRALIEETSGMLVSQKSVILQRITNRLSDSFIIRMMIGSSKPAEIFNLINPKLIFKNMPNIIKTLIEMPEIGRFGLTTIQTKLLPRTLLSLWLKSVRENSKIAKWTAEDLLGRSSIGSKNELNLAILGLSCREIEMIDAWDILSVIMNYRHELYTLRKFTPFLEFNTNLQSCVMGKFIEYMKQKRFLSGDQSDGHVLAGMNEGEIEAIGGEILSMVPLQALQQLGIVERKLIIQEIAKLEMHEMFSLLPLENIHWYGSTLFNDITTSDPLVEPSEDSVFRRKRQVQTGTPSSISNSTATVSAPTNSTAINSSATSAPTVPSAEEDLTLKARAASSTVPVVPPSTSSSGHGINLESLNSMGNLLCYADNLFDNNAWPRSLLKDVLEAKTALGEKTCCLSKGLRDKWFETLKAVYGADTSTWNEFDLTAIGDLLIAVPEQDLLKISTESLGKAATPILRQSSFATKINIPGQIKPIQYVSACVEELVVGKEGLEFMTAYKRLMKRIFVASQWMVNTVKTTQELIRNGLDRTGRIPRWAEHILVKRQVPLSISSGGDISFTGTGATTSSVTQAQPTTFSTVPQQTFVPATSFSPQILSSNQFSSPMMMQQFVQPQPVFAQQPGMVFPQQGVVYMQMQPQPMTFSPQQITFSPQPVFDPTSTGAVAATNAVTAGASAAAGSGAGSGGSFTGSFAQTNANAGNSGTSGFAAGGGGGSFSQSGGADPNANTFAPRAIEAQGQPQPQSQPAVIQSQQGPNPIVQPQQASPNQPGQQQQSNANQPGQQQPPNPTQPGQQQQQNQPGQQSISLNQPGKPSQSNPNQPGQQPSPTTQSQPQPSLVTQGQPPIPSVPAQQQTVPIGGQQQPGVSNPNQQSAIGPVAGAIPPVPNPGQQSNPSQQNGPTQSSTGIVPAQQHQTRSLPNQPPVADKQIQMPQQVFPQQQAVQLNKSRLIPQQNQQLPPLGAPQQQGQPIQQGMNPQQGQSIQQLGPNFNLPTATGRAGGADNFQQGLQSQQSGTERVRSLNFGPLQDDSHNSEITCHGIKSAGAAAIGLTIDDLNKLTPADLFDCVEALGRIEWDEDIKSQILTLLKQKLEFNQDSINALTLIEMGDLVTAFTSDLGRVSNNTSSSNITTVHSDVSRIDLTLPLSLDVLSILGQQVTDPGLLKALAEKFNQDNRIFPGFSEGIARPENLRIVVMSLGNVICGLSDKIVNSIFETDGSLFIDTSKVLGTLEGCRNEVLSTLAAHAIRPTNYGPPRQWSQEDVETVGVVVAGLKPDVISTLPAEAMEGLTPLAVRNMPAPNIVALTPEQLGKISFSAAKAFSQTQFNNFSPAQTLAVESVLHVQTELFNVPAIPINKTESETPDDHQEVVRNIGDSDVDPNEDPSKNVTKSIGARSRDGTEHHPTISVAGEEHNVTEGRSATIPTDNTTANTKSPDAPASSISSKLLPSVNSLYISLLAIVIPVISRFVIV